MKKTIALILVLVLSLSLVACGSSKGSKETTPAPEANVDLPVNSQTTPDNTEIATFVRQNKAELLASLEESFSTSSGMSCSVDVEAVGMGMVMSFYIHEMDDVDAETKAYMQQTYDAMDAYFESILEMSKQDVPSLEYIEYRVCEADGDLIATARADGSVAPATPSVSTNPSATDNSAIIEYVEANKSALLSEMETSFATSSGMTCTSDIKVEGMGFIINISINELDNVDAETKAFLQETYDAMGSYFDSTLDLLRLDLPELEYFEIRVCEVDGDLLATIVAGNK